MFFFTLIILLYAIFITLFIFFIFFMRFGIWDFVTLQGCTLKKGYNKKMFFSSKTECKDQQNYSPNYFFEQPTLHQGFVVNDQALSKAISIIEQLKENLSFALKVNQSLAQQNQQLRSNAEKTTRKVNLDAMAWQKKIKEIQTEKQEIVELLQETKLMLLSTEKQCEQKRLQLQKSNRIISQQKKSYQQLQQNFMNQSINYPIDTSSQNLGKSQIHYISEIQKQNNELQMLVKRYEQQIQKNQIKTNKIEKQNMQFRKWMANVLGLQKVVEGSQKILMREIGNRVLPG